MSKIEELKCKKCGRTYRDKYNIANIKNDIAGLCCDCHDTIVIRNMNQGKQTTLEDIWQHLPKE